MEEVNKRHLKNMWTTYGLDGEELGSGKQSKHGVFKNFMCVLNLNFKMAAGKVSPRRVKALWFDNNVFALKLSLRQKGLVRE